MTKARILFVDDDAYSSRINVNKLRDAGFDVIATLEADEGSRLIREQLFDLYIVDMMMPSGSLSAFETAGGSETGLALARQIRGMNDQAKILIISGNPSIQAEEWAIRDSNARFLHRGTSGHNLVRIAVHLTAKNPVLPRIFLVHGHAHEALYTLKNYLQNSLKYDEPDILFEKPNEGKTLIEKFESYATQADFVFVLLTPDDKANAAVGSDPRTRARQNVIFELGYFMGALRRQSGRVVLLHAGVEDLPSDLFGVVYINIKNGILSAGEEIRRELASWFP